MSSLFAGCRSAQRSTQAADQEDASYDDLVLRSLRTSNPSRLEKPHPSLSGKHKPSPRPFSLDLGRSRTGMPSFDDSTARSLATLVLTGSALWLGARLFQTQKKKIKVRPFLLFGASYERRNIRKCCLLFGEKEGDGRLRKGRSVGKGRASWVLSKESPVPSAALSTSTRDSSRAAKGLLSPSASFHTGLLNAASSLRADELTPRP